MIQKFICNLLFLSYWNVGHFNETFKLDEKTEKYKK